MSVYYTHSVLVASSPPFFTSITEMASSCTPRVKGTQAAPCIITCYNYGGVVTFEVSKQLEAMDNKVKWHAQPALEVMCKLSPPERLVELQLTLEMLDHYIVGHPWVSQRVQKKYNPSGSVFAVFATFPFTEQRLFAAQQLAEAMVWLQPRRAYIDVPGQHDMLMDVGHVL
ncbi:hypothetical protein F4604DRAFT_1941060 [Suillus subluteus]|nr:hypothetical protein F4604DRAFT_1941060 [Suillus subluteus]